MKSQRKNEFCYVIDLICTNSSPRLDYMLDYLSSNLDIKFVQVLEPCDADPHSIVLNYTNEPIDRSLSMFNSGFLFEQKSIDIVTSPEVSHDQGVRLFTSPTDRYHINFDLLSSMFFCLSRYEEYSEFESDTHGRFTGKQSHAYRHGYLKQPVVDQWLHLLLSKINEHSQLQIVPKSTFQIVPTIDVDSAWAFKNRSITHSAGSAIKNAMTLKWDRLKELNIAAKDDTDPYDRFSYLQSTLKEYQVIYFFLMHFKRPYDTAHYVDTDAFSQLVEQVNQHSDIGMHPSYASNDDLNQLKSEQSKLSTLLNRPITASRQHFLKLSLPETYLQLSNLGIEADYSMGYGDQIGFRAGTSKPFKWYNAAEERMTNLMIHPFCVMDVTLKDYLNLQPEDAIYEIQKMKRELQKRGGTFSFIWHNSSFAEMDGWAGWEAVFESLLSSK